VGGSCNGDFAKFITYSRLTAGDSSTFTVRVEGQDGDIAFSPGENRVGIAFIEVDDRDNPNLDTARVIGATSIAIRTIPGN